VCRRWCPALLVAGTLLVGCERGAVRQSYPPDPLFTSKKPVEARAESARPLLAHNEPGVPGLPPTAVASAPREHVVGKPRTPPERTAPPEPVPPPPPPDPVPEAPPPPPPGQETAPAAPAVHTHDAEPVAPPPPAKPVAGTYGHAADYSWLQGTLDRHFHGHLELRYCDPATEDEWGGKVCLDADPRLAEFHEGDVLFVEGEIVRENGAAQRGSWNQYPRYLIRNLELVRHRD
jgi:hypothetical protein